MGMIINRALPKLKKGYPTSTDKYSVRGATLNAETGVVHGGDLIEYVGDESFKKVTATTNVEDIAGVCLSSLTRVVNGLTGDGIASWGAGDTIDLVVGGFIAIEVDESVDLSTIKENGKVYFDEGKILATGTDAIENWRFTGVTDTVDGVKLAGVLIKEVF